MLVGDLLKSDFMKCKNNKTQFYSSTVKGQKWCWGSEAGLQNWRLKSEPASESLKVRYKDVNSSYT